ncbi:dihydropteroate synthase [Taibaiella koreensis]|uniref:dihydropteroate synthase n=1 Tax=Taibaiella koreensis TaxID=1268548 RepID=UPI000E59A110|nr:dihydropteroate synthase [Taibaiella koreensis]
MIFQLNANGRLLTASQPVVMGILNVTPDSFYTRGRENTPEDHLRKAEKMLAEGAGILDIGGMSTRPRADVISPEEEIARVTPVIGLIRRHFPETFISIDTYRAAVARAAVEAGADIVNDISAGNLDAGMLTTVAALKAPYILMHMQGTPADMQQHPHYKDVVADILDFFLDKIHRCREAGINDIILDPGFGFGKTQTHNFQLLKGMHAFALTGLPVLAGLSRKSMVYRLLQSSAEEALNGTTALHMLALQQGAAILRVHDVREAVECVKLYHFYQTIQEI